VNAFAIAIFLLTFFMLWGILYKGWGDWRSAFLCACIAWASALVAITEILSLFKALTFAAVLGAWIVCFLVVLGLWTRLIGNPRRVWETWRLPPMPREELYLLLGGGFIACAVGVVAGIAPPNTNDALTYHMPRVMHWIQDRNLAFYPTHILRQLYLSPGSEFIILHFQILSGSDHFANFVQWFSMLGSAIGVSLIARELGAAQRGQVFSALAALAIPVGILQASNPQSDYVTSLWLTGFVYWMYSLTARGDYWSAAAAGMSLGLAALTKATTYILAFPFLLWFGVLILKRYRAKAAGLLALAAMLFILLNLGGYIRAWGLFGNPLGITRDPMIQGYASNDVFSLAELESNIVRNTAIHMGMPLSLINSTLERAVADLHKVIGISQNDPRTTWFHTRFRVHQLAFFEYTDGNFLHLFLIIASAVYLLYRPARKWRVIIYALCLLVAFLAFCFYLKWQPWSARLQLPLFVLYAAVLGKAGAEIRPGWVAGAITMVVLLGALPWVFLNQSRPLIGDQNILATDRTSLYFRNQPSDEAHYVAAVHFVAESLKQCRQVGISLRANDPEYALWVLLQRSLGKDVWIESVNVSNISSQAAGGSPGVPPCAVLTVGPTQLDTLNVQGRIYTISKSFDLVSVFTPR
jgi:hypothetical protein